MYLWETDRPEVGDLFMVLLRNAEIGPEVKGCNKTFGVDTLPPDASCHIVVELQHLPPTSSKAALYGMEAIRPR